MPGGLIDGVFPMNDPNRKWKWVLVIGLVVLSLLVLYPPRETLKGGIDLVGGTSLLFEIDTAGLTAEQQAGLSTKVMGILKERVDPNSQLNLEWRPVGNTRLEIRMPQPPKEARARREAYNQAVDRVKAKNLTRFEVESALNASGAERDNLLQGLARGLNERTALIEAAKTAFDEHRAAQGGDDAAKVTAASEAYERAVADLLATSLSIARVTDVLGLSPGEPREKEFEKLRKQYPAYDAGSESAPDGKLLTKAKTAHDDWASSKADLEDPSDLKRRLRGSGVLEFRILAERDPSSPGFTTDEDPQLRQPIDKYVEQLKSTGPRRRVGDRFLWAPVENLVRFMHLDDIRDFEKAKSNPQQPIVEEYAGRYYGLAHADETYGLLHSGGKKTWTLTEAVVDRDPMSGQNVVSFALDPRGAQRFGELTGNNIGRQLCIVLDGAAMSHATIQSQITDRGQISGKFTIEQVQDLVRILEAGSLPARLRETPLMENTIGPSLGETNRTMGLRAAVWGGVIVFILVAWYYGLVAGGVANLALALNVLFLLAVMALLDATFTLPGIAGLVLSLGCAIDANVLIFERVREERERGVVFRKALNAGYDKAFSTILDSNLTTLLSAVILGFVGTEEVKGFAITLGIGIAISMFTALTVTRLIFNTMVAKGWLNDFSMRKLIKTPNIDWIGLRRFFWPASLVASVGGLVLYVGLCITLPQAMFDVEFLGGTSLQIDLKPEVVMTDEQMTARITGEGLVSGETSASSWLASAAGRLEAAEVVETETPGTFQMSSAQLSGHQLAALMGATLEGKVSQGGVRPMGQAVTLEGRPGRLTSEGFRQAVADAAKHVREAAGRIAAARVQGVGEVGQERGTRQSFEIVTIETDRVLVQAAILACLGEQISVQRAIAFQMSTDSELTMAPYFVVESDDQYLSSVIGGDATFDIRRFRGGVAAVVQLDQDERPLALAEFEKRLNEISLQPEFEAYRTRDTALLPLDEAAPLPGGQKGYRRFAALATDEAVRYDEDSAHWADALAKPFVAQIEAALGQEKSLTKVVQFAATIAEQTRNRALFAIFLALGGVGAYLWLRFGTLDYGLAAIVAMFHDVAITLGLLAAGQFLSQTAIGALLLLEPFRTDLTMIAAVLTVIGYSLNDKIVIFDRIRENKGRLGTLNARMINNSVNQTLSRTVLTGSTTILSVLILYIFGGKGVHGFSYALLIGIVVGTYSSIGVGAALVYRTTLLHSVVWVTAAVSVVGVVFAVTPDTLARLILAGITVIACAVLIARTHLRGERYPSGEPASA